MTKLLDRAMMRAQRLSPAMQDEVARLVLLFAGDEDGQDVVLLTPEEEADLSEADAEMARGEIRGR